ncbi:MAG: hypothetical protein KatS3mg110_0414 [Pirellulaceae bacterium]|nr:MAG: hypothetical protein KatS3mg110_0414 [Pirellulaceae bacterium]
MSDKTVLVAGIGSPHGDDQAGWLVVDMMSTTRTADFVRLKKAHQPLDFLDWLPDTDALHIIDACRLPVPADVIYRWRWPEGPWTRGTTVSSHGWSLVSALDLASKLGLTPQRVSIWGVPGKQFRADSPPSDEVVFRARYCAMRVTREITKSLEVC